MEYKLPQIGAFDVMMGKFDVAKLNLYLKSSRWDPIVSFRQLFPKFLVDKYAVYIPMSLDDYNQKISTYFPIKLWSYFSYDQNRKSMIINLIELNSILSYLNTDLLEFVTPETVPFNPSELPSLNNQIQSLLGSGGLMIRNEHLNIPKDYLFRLNQGYPEYVIIEDNFVLVPIRYIQEFYEWLQDAFPREIVDDTNWKKLKLFVYFGKLGLGPFIEDDQLITANLSSNPSIDDHLIEEKMNQDGEDLTRYLVTNIDSIYDQLWQSVHAVEIEQLANEVLQAPAGLLGQISRYLS